MNTIIPVQDTQNLIEYNKLPLDQVTFMARLVSVSVRLIITLLKHNSFAFINATRSKR